MFDHVQIKVADLLRATAFYKAVLDVLGHRVVLDIDGVVVGIGRTPHDMLELRKAGPTAPLSTSVHLAFVADSREAVDRFYEVALDSGATCNGAPGPRPDYEPGYYAAFVLDPDGHNLEAVFLL